MRDAGLIASVLALVGVVIQAVRTWRSDTHRGQTDVTVAKTGAAASEVEKLGARLDAQATRLDDQAEEIDDLRSQVRGLLDYIAADHAEHRRNDWPITPLPEALA